MRRLQEFLKRRILKGEEGKEEEEERESKKKTNRKKRRGIRNLGTVKRGETEIDTKEEREMTKEGETETDTHDIKTKNDNERKRTLHLTSYLFIHFPFFLSISHLFLTSFGSSWIFRYKNGSHQQKKVENESFFFCMFYPVHLMMVLFASC